jgi:hypothetical protein
MSVANTELYRVLRKLGATEDDALAGAGNAAESRLAKVEIKLDFLTQVSIGLHMLTLAGIVGLFLQGGLK